MRIFVLAALAVSLLGGCLEVDDTVTLYMAADGKTDFTAFLDDVRSNESDAKERDAENALFAAEIRAGKFAKDAFKKSGVHKLRQKLVRERLPYTAVISGEFDEATAPWKLLGFDGTRTVTFEKSNEGRKLVFRYPDGEGKIDDFPRHLKIVLLEGSFGESRGFVVSKDKRTAVPDKDFLAKQIAAGKAFQTELRW